ncbi:ParM/StbA family protein [Leptolyngbya sp. NIES-2104]|uniref:ParM/StbA family protein n=1 Tax=Leptolyngbya sp. NIES-2104 TaxID=1552121 RepID=UPI0006EC5207|nr:ParM/StbA family protein [Leptolyngbya sp. NIES-2104]GAQ00173.1 hypothetical protein NIES2104_67380 [Leptolyngbya sp. NIES-2104]
MPDLILAIDAGGSQTKIVYTYPASDHYHYLVISPEVEQIPKQRLQEYLDRQGWIGSPVAENRAWIECQDEVFILGAFAQNFNPEDRIKERKYENALYKVLAAIGVIVRRHNLPVRKKLSICLGILLPWNEYNDRDLFEDQLKLMLSNYKFQDLSLRVEIERFLCRPEGGGIAVSRIRQKGSDWLRAQQLGVLMVGHRNVSALHFDRGELKVGDSPLLGFSILLKRVEELVGGLNLNQLASALSQAMKDPPSMRVSVRYSSYENIVLQYPKWQELKSIQALSSAKSAQLRAKEVDRIANAIELATQDYWEKLEQWLNKVLPPSLNLDEVLLGGGAAVYLKPNLERYFNYCESIGSSYSGTTTRYTALESGKHSTKLDWSADLQAQITRYLGISTQNDRSESMVLRFIDCFGLFDYLVSLSSKQNEKTSGEQP